MQFIAGNSYCRSVSSWRVVVASQPALKSMSLATAGKNSRYTLMCGTELPLSRYTHWVNSDHTGLSPCASIHNECRPKLIPSQLVAGVSCELSRQCEPVGRGVTRTDRIVWTELRCTYVRKWVESEDTQSAHSVLTPTDRLRRLPIAKPQRSELSWVPIQSLVGFVNRMFGDQMSLRACEFKLCGCCTLDSP